ncbi:extracellular solute-binding protein [Metabacillus arenae]|uniref:Extracellular solute-binding protein n=1 Tax=Metabacillus arenae TaxID=2771434 RepID=A0A926S0G2_9BACI|nr:extracellular solute-binding protein [Metabacillus arenae]MBD1383267.1 extracellular solute-binding protein [Metabacillus arenae]
MKKWSRVVPMLLLSLSLLATGCQNSSSTQTGSESQNQGNENKEFTLEWMAHPNYSLSASDVPRAEYLKGVVEEFEKENPSVNIKSSTLASTNSDESMAKLYEQASSGRAPDMAMIDGYMIDRFKDYLQPLDTYLEKAGIKEEDLFPFVQDVVKGEDGKIYALYFSTDVRVMFYRKDLIPNPPKTFDELLKIGEQVKSQGFDALLLPGGRGEGAMTTSLWPQFWSQGGELVDEQGNPNFGEGDNKTKMLNVFNFYKQAIASEVVPKRVSSYTRENDMNGEVSTGKVAMFFGGNWQVENMKQILPKEEFEKWAIAPIPTSNANDKALTTAGGWSFGVFTDDPEKQEAAVNFLLKAYFGDEGMAKWNSIAGSLPTRKSVYDSEHYQRNEFSPTFKEYLDTMAKVRPSAGSYGKVTQALQVALSEVTSGTKTPEAALDEAWIVVNKK